MEIWELLKRLQRQPSAEGIMSGNKAGVQNVDPTPVDVYNFLQGTGAGLAGMPVDLASTAMRPFGYNTPPEQTVGSSEWFGRQMGADPSSRSFTAGTFGSPDPTDALRMTSHLDDLLQAMTVLHASPHAWDKVDLSKVGTGEGIQAYGHGFYAAENPAVAQGYFEGFSSGSNRPDIWLSTGEKFPYGSPQADLLITRAHDPAVKTVGDVRQELARSKAKWESSGRTDWDNPEDALEGLSDDATFRYGSDNAHLYELDLPEETIGKMLDWDKPLRDQREVLERVMQNQGISRETALKASEDFEIASQNQLSGDLSISEWEEFSRRPEVIMGELLKKVEAQKNTWGYDQSQKTVGEALYSAISRFTGGDKAASEYLNSLGIPGIKYFDGFSRGKGEGTRNFVIFDEQHITPLTRNGQPLRVPYKNAPDSLMGFSKPERGQKGFDDQNYAKEIVIRGTFSDGQTFVDAIRGLNTSHALERARRNWEGAKIEVLGEGKRGMSDLPEWLKLFEDNP